MLAAARSIGRQLTRLNVVFVAKMSLEKIDPNVAVDLAIDSMGWGMMCRNTIVIAVEQCGIQKDDYMEVNYTEDAVFTSGDKFGSNKHDSKVGATSKPSDRIEKDWHHSRILFIP